MASGRRRSRPVISLGRPRLSRLSIVGAMSRRRAVGAQAEVLGLLGHIDQRHRVGGVRGVRLAGDGIDHGLAVAVIGGDDPDGVALLDGLVDAGELAVDGLDGLDGRGQNAGVADHVGIGEVGDHHVEAGVENGLLDACRRP